jgi:hypothetical protein
MSILLCHGPRRRLAAAFGLAVVTLFCASGAAGAAPFKATGSGTVSGAGRTTFAGTVQASHLGRGTFSGIEFTPLFPPLCSSGSGTPTSGSNALTAANGDVLQTEFSGTVCQSAPFTDAFDLTATYTITGGTGRFANATGTGTTISHAEFGPGFSAGPDTITTSGIIDLH